MNDYETSLMFNAIAVVAKAIAVLLLFVIGAIFFPWWLAKIACILGAVWYVFRGIAAYYMVR